MALSRVKSWIANEVLTAADLNAEFNNILNNALSLISPLTGNLNANLRSITNLLLETQAASQSAATEGRVYYQTTEDQVHVDDGTNIRRVPTIASVARGDVIRASATSQFARLALGAAGTILRSDGTDIGYSTLTVPNTASLGDVLVASAANTMTSTALNAIARGHLAGLTLSNGTDATNDIDIAVGSAMDSTNVMPMVLSSALTKQLDAAWAVGTNAGGLDTGAIADTTYHVWLIKRSDTGVVDALFSTSASAPTMPTNYDYRRRIGSIVRTGGAIKAFVQAGDLFQWTVATEDYDTTNPGTNAITQTLTLPTGLNVEALINASARLSSANSLTALFTDLAITDTAPSFETASTGQLSVQGSTATDVASGQLRIRVNTSAQIRARLSFSDAGTRLHVATQGWYDRRGRDS